MIKNLFKQGDVIISTRTIAESLMILSPNANRRLLLPVLYNYDTFKVNAIKLIESIVLHERIFSFYDEHYRKILLLNSNTNCLNDLIFSIPKSILQPLVDSQVNSTLTDLFNNSYNIDQCSPEFNSLRKNLENIYFDMFNEAHSVYSHSEDNQVRELQHSIFLINDPELSVAANMMIYRQSEFPTSYPFKCLSDIEAEKLSLTYGINFTSTYETQVINDFARYKENSIILTVNELIKQTDKINTWLQNNYFTLTTPLVFDYIVHKAKKNDNLLEIALDVRNSKEATAFRKQCVNFETAAKIGSKKQLIEMIREVENAMTIFARNLDAPLINLDISLSYPPGVSFSVQEVKEHTNFKQKKYLVFLSRLYQSALESNHTMDKFVRLLK